MGEPTPPGRIGASARLLTWYVGGAAGLVAAWVVVGWALGGRWAAAGLITTAVGLLGLWLGTRWVAASLRELTADAHRVAGGAVAVSERGSAVRELDDLARALTGFTELLGERSRESARGEETLRTVLESLAHGVLLVEPDGRIGYHNSAAVDALGPIPDHLSRLVPVALQRLVAAGAESGEPQMCEVDHGFPPRLLRATATRIAGPSARVVLVVTDVTERRRVEAMRRDFVADASHELKTPLSGILASTDAFRLALTRDPARAEGFADRVEASARQLERIVEDLLDLSRLESTEPAMEPIAIGRVVREEVDRASPRAAELGLVVSASLDEATVSGSERDLSLAIRNLLDNAIRYTAAGGHIAVTVAATADYVEVSVSDTGQGIPSRALERIFERFYRVDVARSRATGGTGLGLAIVKHAVERHGGSVTVESTLGEGSTFWIRLPPTADRS